MGKKKEAISVSTSALLKYGTDAEHGGTLTTNPYLNALEKLPRISLLKNPIMRYLSACRHPFHFNFFFNGTTFK